MRSKTDSATRERLLEAAAHTIADLGFAQTTVREVCRRARANVAAVNYHFGSKDALVLEAVRWTASRVHEGPPPVPPAGADPRVALREAVRAFGRRILGREAWETRLMMRVLAEPNAAVDAVVREFVEPRVRALEGAVRPFLPDASPRRLRLTVISIVAQFFHHRVASPVTLRLLGERAMTDALAEEICDHVAAFVERAVGADRAPRDPAPKGDRP